MKTILMLITLLALGPTQTARAGGLSCSEIFGDSSRGIASAKLRLILAEVPARDQPWTTEMYKNFQTEVNSIVPTSEPVHDFLWEYAQTLALIEKQIDMSSSDSIFYEGKVVESRVIEAKTRQRKIRQLEDVELEIISQFRPTDKVAPLISKYREILSLALDMSPIELESLVTAHLLLLEEVRRLPRSQSVEAYLNRAQAIQPILTILFSFQGAKKLLVLQPSDFEGK